jgi:hypothetical protein
MFALNYSTGQAGLQPAAWRRSRMGQASSLAARGVVSYIQQSGLSPPCTREPGAGPRLSLL